MHRKIGGKFIFWGALAALSLLIAITYALYIHNGEEAKTLRATILSSSVLAQQCKAKDSFILNGVFFAYRSDKPHELELDYLFKCNERWAQANGKYVTTEIGWKLQVVDVTIGAESFVLMPLEAQPKTK